MERKKNIYLAFFLFLPVSLNATYKQQIYKSYVTNDMAMWKLIIDRMESEKNKPNDFRLELINNQYGYIAWCIGNKKTELARIYIKKAKENIDFLEQKKYNLSMIYAYKSTFIGFEIGLNKIKAPFIGPKSIEYAKKSIALDSNNALGYIQGGNIEFYMPSIFGGSKRKASEYYLKALNIMEKNPEAIRKDWNYLCLLASTINAFIEIKDYTKAKYYCEKTLKIEPDFLWVKNELYPEILKKFNK